MVSVKSLRGLCMCFGVCGVIAVNLICPVNGGESKDLYRVLGVSRSASQKEIKDSYKRQAKLWHPDKNKSPEAMEKLISINGAYEVLSNTEKRHLYDITGEVGDSPQRASHSTGHGFTFFQGGSTFRFQFPSGSSHRSDDISTQQFFEHILINSHHKPYLLNFYTDFCVLCSSVGNMWKVLHKDLSVWGVGLGSVHANLHPRVTRYCGVSHVPTVVGVVSGRIVRFSGQIQDKATMSQFLESIFPTSMVTTITERNMESFLSDATVANKPRVIIFSPRQQPSLLFKLTAFSNQNSVDFGFASSHSLWASTGVLERFGVLTGEKLLAVFKEDYAPATITKGVLNQAVLQSAVKGLMLLLPRLSSQAVLDSVCPLTASNRLCVILTVGGSSTYNDSLTAAFKRTVSAAFARNHMFAYIDKDRQADFLAPFLPFPIEIRLCLSGQRARPVLVLKRSSNQFDWFNQFCGEDGDMNKLDMFLSQLRSKFGQMNRFTMVPLLHDEHAPGWLSRVWNRVLLFFTNFDWFQDVLDSGFPTVLMSFIFPIMILCMFLLLMGKTDSDEEKTKSSTSRKNRHHSSSVGHSTHRQQSPHVPSSHQAQVVSPPHARFPHQARLVLMDGPGYTQFVQDSSRSKIALVILINTHSDTEAKHLLQSFWKIASVYTDQRLLFYYLCYQTHSKWLLNILKQSEEEMDSDEINFHTVGCLSGEVATVIALLGSRKQFCIFPEYDHTHSEGVATYSTIVSEQTRALSESVGGVLGTMLGFTEDSETESDNETDQSDHKTNSAPPSNGTPGTCVDSRVRGHLSSSEMNHNSGLVPVGQERPLKRDPRIDQIRDKFEMWMERFADGTVKRHVVKKWPDWRTDH